MAIEKSVDEYNLAGKTTIRYEQEMLRVLKREDSEELVCRSSFSQRNQLDELESTREGVVLLETSHSPTSSSSDTSRSKLDCIAGNKCGKCQNHEIQVSKKGHARDCPFKKCSCRRCRLLDARSDILQVISGKETKLKGTKKDPNCGFCQNHGVKILRKGHVRSCHFGQERHFKLDNCFDCEVHYIRNEVNRLQIKMRRAMKEDRTLSEEQRKTAREAITRDEVEKVCDMARQARKKRESMLKQQAGECSSSQSLMQTPAQLNHQNHSNSSQLPPLSLAVPAEPKLEPHPSPMAIRNSHQTQQQQFNQLARESELWRPWSQHQVAAAMAAQQQLASSPIGQHQQQQQLNQTRRQVNHATNQMLSNNNQLTSAITSMVAVANLANLNRNNNNNNNNNNPTQQTFEQSNNADQPIPLVHRNQLQEQQLFNTIFRLLVAQIATTAPANR